MNVCRPALDEALGEFVSSHGIVVGVPGGGKSHSVRQLLRTVEAQGGAAVPVPVASLRQADNAELKSIFSYAEPDFFSFLRRYGHGLSPRVVAFDGFDAARDPSLRATMIATIRRCQTELGGWTVIVSVRSYEAKHSADLLGLFPGTPAAGPYRSPDLRCRHFLVPSLSAAEVAEAIGSLPSIPSDFVPGERLLELLRVPFNISLLEAIAIVR